VPSRKVSGLRHFFVLASNKTIYEKLISDFSPGIGPWQINYVNPADDPRKKTD
jgi:hypothetical protein